MTWQPGRDRVAELLRARELEQVTAAPAVAQLLLDDAGRHLATAATACASGDFSGAYQLAYDAIAAATQARHAAATILEQNLLTAW